MDILILEKALNTVKTIVTLAVGLNVVLWVAIAYRYVSNKSMDLK